MMWFNVAQLLKENVGATRTYDVVNELDSSDADIPALTGRVHFTRTKDGILVRASLDGAVPSTCSRCLEDFDAPIHLDIEEEYFPVIDVITGRPLQQPEDQSSFTISENHILDLTEAVRQYTLLALPMQPICSPECAGICPKCGKIHKEGQCEFDEPSVDPRLAGLNRLLNETESGLQQEKGAE